MPEKKEFPLPIDPKELATSCGGIFFVTDENDNKILIEPKLPVNSIICGNVFMTQSIVGEFISNEDDDKKNLN